MLKLPSLSGPSFVRWAIHSLPHSLRPTTPLQKDLYTTTSIRKDLNLGTCGITGSGTAAQSQLKFYWEKGVDNHADYPTKHHPTKHHRAVRPRYIQDKLNMLVQHYGTFLSHTLWIARVCCSAHDVTITSSEYNSQILVYTGTIEYIKLLYLRTTYRPWKQLVFTT
jgi:hypothetical protein